MKRKNVILAACAMLSLPISAQQYEVSGRVPANVKVVYMQNWQGRQPDSVAVTDGKFKFTGDAEGKIFAMVAPKDETLQTIIPVVLDGKVEVDLTSGSVKGTAENEALTAWYQKMEPSRNVLNQLTQEYYTYAQKGQQVPDSVDERINKAYTEESEKLYAMVKACCEENLQSKFPAFFLANYASRMDRAEVIALLEKGDAVYSKVGILDQLKRVAEGWKKQMPGTMFTDLTLHNTNNEAHKLSEYIGKGKYILIDFWASWCGPCRQAMPSIKALYNKYKDKGFDIVGLSFDQDKTAWVNAIKKMEMPWIHLSDLKGWESIAAKTYGINAIPATLLIGPDGKIIVGGLHAEELDQKLSELLK